MQSDENFGMFALVVLFWSFYCLKLSAYSLCVRIFQPSFLMHCFYEFMNAEIEAVSDCVTDTDKADC